MKEGFIWMKSLHNISWLYIIIAIVLLSLLIKWLLPFYEVIVSFILKVSFPFVLAIVISYLLYPLLNLLINVLNMHKTSAIVVIFLAFFSLLTIFIYRAFPVFFYELEDLSVQLPQLITMYEQIIYTLYDSTSFMPEAVHEQLDSLIVSIELTLKTYVEKVINRLIHFFDDIITILMVPVLVFYMLKDFTNMRNYIYELLPKKHRQSVERILSAVHEAFGTYIRGQIILSMFIFTITFLFFKLINMKYTFVLSLFMGIMNIIPYFGPIIGTIPALIVALSISTNDVIFVILIAIVVQIVESTLLSPYIMGKTAKLHPILIIFILLVSSEIGGIVAMIVAIPLVMILKAIYIKLYVEKQQCVDN